MSRGKKLTGVGLVCALFMIAAVTYAAKDGKAKGAGADFVVPDSSSMDVSSCRYTQTEEDREAPNKLAELTGFECKMENDSLALYYSEETAGIRIRNKESGYVWGGLQEKKPEDLNQKWSAMANSIITIDYLDAKCKSNRLALGDSGHIQFEWGKEESVCTVSFGAIGISLAFTMKLNDDRLTVEILQDSIQEKGENKLQSVWILPFLGTVREDETPGYIFVPDGSGALIRYNKSGTYSSVYDERVYGKDVSVDRLSTAGDLVAKRNNDYLVETFGVTVPVYGSVHGVNQNAYMAVIESGMEYASIYASPAGMVTAYNWACARFDYRQVYSHPVNKGGSAITTTQEAPEHVAGRVTFYFLTGMEANYSAMAVKYRETAKDSGILENAERTEENIPLYLRIVAGTVQEGILLDGYNRLTSIGEAQDIVTDLLKNSIPNLTVAYDGWQKRGIGGARYGTKAMDSRLGSKGDLLELRRLVQEGNGRFYLSLDPISFNEDQARTASTAAFTISKKYASYTRSNRGLMYPTEYYAHPSRVVSVLQKVEKEYDGYGFDLANIGAMIYGDYSKNEKMSRSGCMELFSSVAAEAGANQALEHPNQYMWNSTADYTNMPMNNSQYLFETDSVPFLQIVLKGSIDYYAPYANQGFYNKMNRLKMIEYGAYPSFIVIARENERLKDTPLEDYFSLNYNDWSDIIREVYGFVNGALKKVEGSAIVEHRMLAVGVAAVTYDNGKTIYVNYLNEEYVTGQGLHIPAQSYFVANE